jgi:hypothetical protein
MLAPIVAVIPTTTVGDCWSIEPSPLPVNEDGSLAGWVVANLDNNIDALLIVGSIALLLAFVIWRMNLRDPRRKIEVQPGTKVVLIGTAVALLIAWLLKHFQRDLFLANAHGKSAVLLFLFLWLAILANVLTHWRAPGRPWVSWYVALAAVMVVGIPISFLFGTHQIFALEAWEITAFATYWVVQTVENWDEKVVIPDRRDEGLGHVARS